MQPNHAREIRRIDALLAAVRQEKPKTQYGLLSKEILIQIYENDKRHIERVAHKNP